MPQRFVNPFPQFLTDAPAVREGARLFFYEAEGATKLDTYPTADLSGTANANPIELNEYGYPPVNIFLQDRAYKVVLAPPGEDDPPSSVIWTADKYRPSDFSILTIRKVGSGNPTGVVAGTAGSNGVLPTEYWDYTNEILYICTLTGDAADAEWTALNAESAAAIVIAPQGYLSASASTPIVTSDVTSATAITYHRMLGNLVPIYNGASFTPIELGSDLTLTLHSSHAANAIHDVFVFSNSGVPTLITGPAWSTPTVGSGARGTGAGTTELQRINGLWTNKVEISGRNGSTTYTVGANLATYLGSIYIDGSAGQVTCHRSWGQNRKFGVWNAYNRRRIILRCGDSTSSWSGSQSYSTFAPSNGSNNNKIIAFTGLAEEVIACNFQQDVDTTAAARAAYIGIGINATTSASGTVGHALNGTDGALLRMTLTAKAVIQPSLGLNNINALDAVTGGAEFKGTEALMVLEADYWG